ncbi:Islet cell autoantigen 1 [Melipona quadrifasciata]|uniref:Islet cell autoantigen 1 n=1 Tax=Melipona quadrifasciata TaxID=166423 RepID=A0A0N0BL08_9HYME|nr:Islet cell autoantigen 1 [Melipona quadrifasciata]
MQHQFWVTKQTLSRKLGKKEDECIVASDAELDAKLELFHSIQKSCLNLQRIIDRYQERLCYLAQEENAMGRFLKDAGKQDKTRAGKMMITVGKSLSYSGQQRLALSTPLERLYQEVETFRQRAIEDTLQKVQAMEKARTEYRAALSWMKNVSQELDPDTSKQLERFRKVQTCVRQGKIAFDNLALDCLQKVDLLAAARCNMFSHALVLYQSTLLSFTEKSAQAYSTIANSFKGYQRYNFMVVRELAEPSSKLAQETGGDNDLDEKEKLSFFDIDYHDTVEKAEEVKSSQENTVENNKESKKLLDIEYETIDMLGLEGLDINSSSPNDEITSQSTSNIEHKKDFDELFENLILDNNATHNDIQEGNQLEFDKKFDEQKEQNSREQSLQSLTSENMVLLNDILTDKQNSDSEWESIAHNTFLPPNILKQSLGDATLGVGQKSMPTTSTGDKKKNKTGKLKGNSWLDLFAELDPLANNPMENLSSDSNASA